MLIAPSQVADRNENQILLAARLVREYYFTERRSDRHDWILVLAIREFLDRSPNATPEDLYDLFINQSRIKTEGHLSRYLAAAVAADAIVSCSANSLAVNVFTGARRFSFAKLSAMTAFITLHSKNVCKQKLRYLLFYGDFVNFFLHGHSISGARYVRRPFGPVLHRYDNLLRTLVYSGVVRFKDHGNDEGAVILRDQVILGELTIHETVTMNWVLANLGSMTGPELSQYTHREIAHRFTRQDGFIAYEYASVLQKLPDRSLV